tara:strand:+ start:337 stop:573 length:237 start_codon:yes stop_codon:yes gene_type:complete
MGFNKRHLDKEIIISAFKQGGSKGVTDLYKADAIIQPADSPVCHYIEKIMCKEESIEYKRHLIDTYMVQLLEGLYPFK